MFNTEEINKILENAGFDEIIDAISPEPVTIENKDEDLKNVKKLLKYAISDEFQALVDSYKKEITIEELNKLNGELKYSSYDLQDWRLSFTREIIGKLWDSEGEVVFKSTLDKHAKHIEKIQKERIDPEYEKAVYSERDKVKNSVLAWNSIEVWMKQAINSFLPAIPQQNMQNPYAR